jgi:hypothetical protein
MTGTCVYGAKIEKQVVSDSNTLQEVLSLPKAVLVLRHLFFVQCCPACRQHWFYKSVMNFKTWNNLAGWLVFAVAGVVLALAAEPTGSLWDCGEFIAGAYKLQVVHPPGAPIFLLVGRMFTWVASMFSSDPQDIAYSINLMSALSTAAAAMFICWSTTILGKLTLVGRDGELDNGQTIAVLSAGVVAGLTTAFCTSIWFSAVEGEVYAMSTFFTCMTLWSTLKWYQLPDSAQADRWMVFTFFVAALSMGVHLLSLLTFPALAMFYYFKKTKTPTVMGMLTASFVGVLFIVGIQYFIISGIPRFWAFFDRIFVNSFGLPFYSGIIGVFLIFGGAIWGGLYYAKKTGNGLLQRLVVALGLVVIAYLSYGTVIIRAVANTPINMNDPSDPMRLLPYLNREQYGERPLLFGPSFEAKPIDVISEPRYGRLGDRYEIVDEKTDYKYAPGSSTLFPRMSDPSQGRPAMYRKWINKPTGSITFFDNLKFFFRYQVNWMWWRYFMWNFSGRQNGDQGYNPWDPSAGHWITGFDAIDQSWIGNQDHLPDFQRNGQANNRYYLIPFLLGLVGLVFHYRRRKEDFYALFAMFIITGIGIIVYSNQPPSEPRERDYVLVGSFFTFAIWIGMSVLAIYDVLSKRNTAGPLAAYAGLAVGLVAPLLMVTQNWDDHSRAKHYGSRDYAKNFLESCQPNAIIFTYGDNDTYPLWYCQEVENIRTDVRVVNLSLIAVDWYISQLRRKVNNSPAIKMSIPQEQIRGKKRVQIPYPFYDSKGPRTDKPMQLKDLVKFLGEDHRPPGMEGASADFQTYLPTRYVYMPVNKEEVFANNVVARTDTAIVDTIYFDLGEKTSYIIKDQLAILDIIASNAWERPIYWAVTSREDKLMGLDPYLQLEGLGLRLVPVRSQGQMRSFGMVGAGRVNTDQAFENIMTKWAWGNFDKERLFVNKSYLPSLQTMQMTFMRVGQQLVAEGKKDKALQLADKFFEVFPRMNFQHNQFSAYVAELYFRCDQPQKGADKVREIAGDMEQQFRFYASQDADMQKAYQQDASFAMGTVETLMRAAYLGKDQALVAELEKQFAPYIPEDPSRRALPPGGEIQR